MKEGSIMPEDPRAEAVRVHHVQFKLEPTWARVKTTILACICGEVAAATDFRSDYFASHFA